VSGALRGRSLAAPRTGRSEAKNDLYSSQPFLMLMSRTIALALTPIGTKLNRPPCI
jgi:hypothetical protein